MPKDSLRTQAAKMLGRRGGKKTQAARTPEQRRAWGQLGARVRWGKPAPDAKPEPESEGQS